MKKITVRKEAEAEIEEAYQWYESKKEGLGEEFINYLDTTLDKIKVHPEIFPTVHRNVRRAFMYRFPYGVFYFEKDETLIVFAVMHARRDSDKWLSRI